MYSYIVRRLLLMIPTLIGITLLAYMVMSVARTSKYDMERAAMFGFLDVNGGAEGGASSGPAVKLVDKYPEYFQVERLTKRFEFDVPIVFNTNVQGRNQRIMNSFYDLYAKMPAMDMFPFLEVLERFIKETQDLLNESSTEDAVIYQDELKILSLAKKSLEKYAEEGEKVDLKWSHEEALTNEISGYLTAIDKLRSKDLIRKWDSYSDALNKRLEFRQKRDVAVRHLKKYKTAVYKVLSEELSEEVDETFKNFIFAYMSDSLGLKKFKNQTEFDLFWEIEKEKSSKDFMRSQILKYLNIANVDEDEAAKKIYEEHFVPRATLYVPLFFNMFDEFNNYFRKKTLLDLFEFFAVCNELSYYDKVGAEELLSLRSEASYWYHNRDMYLNFENLSALGSVRCFFLNARYGRWLRDICQFNFRFSESLGKPVLDCVKDRLPISLRFGLIGFILSYTVCIPLGIMKSLKHNSKFDLLSSIFVFIGYSIPGWALGSILLTMFGGGLFPDMKWFPLSGIHSSMEEYMLMSSWEQFVDNVHHSILPIVAYMVGSFTTLTMLMKNSMMENLGQDYVRTAFAKGLSEKRVIFLHAMRNSLIPLCTGLGHMMSIVLAGSYLIEKVFDIEGFGLMGFEALMRFDINLLMGVLLISSVLMVLGNLISDILYSMVDPRVRFK